MQSKKVSRGKMTKKSKLTTETLRHGAHGEKAVQQTYQINKIYLKKVKSKS